MSTKNRTRCIWGAAIFLIFAATVTWALSNSEPGYRNKPLSYWFNQLGLTCGGTNGAPLVMPTCSLPGRNYGNYLETDESVRAAFRGMGTNALPYLLRKLQETESVLHRPIQSTAIKLGFARLPLPSIDVQRRQAITGLVYLRPLPDWARSQLQNIKTTARNPKVKQAAWDALDYTRPENVPPGHPK
jgi:hypothetical protein